MKRFATALVAMAIPTLAVPAAAQGQWWSQHPGYLHAMSDLRTAYWMIQHRAPSDPGQSAAEGRAMGAIRAAYATLSRRPSGTTRTSTTSRRLR